MIQLEKLSAGYGGAPILHDITLSVPRGDFLAVIGPNGCGKTTFLRTVAGLNSHYSGEILLAGRPLSAWPRMEMSRFAALLPQTREIPAMDVQTLVTHGRFPYCGVFRRLSGDDRRMISEAMETLGISSLRYANIRELSGGECQKAFLAMMLAQDADLLLLDEPTTYLDAGFQLEILETLRCLNRRGKTVVAVLHDLNHAFGLARHVALLENGRLLCLGTPDDLIQSGQVDRTFRVRTRVLSDTGKKYYAFESPASQVTATPDTASEWSPSAF